MGLAVLLVTPATFRTYHALRYEMNYPTVNQALWTNQKALPADRAFGLSTEVANAGNCPTSLTFDCMIIAEFIAALVTPGLGLCSAHSTGFSHLARPCWSNPACVIHKVSLERVLQADYQSS
jgi:hypothetical protein